jgi:hypothetical protein
VPTGWGILQSKLGPSDTKNRCLTNRPQVESTSLGKQESSIGSWLRTSSHEGPGQFGPYPVHYQIFATTSALSSVNSYTVLIGPGYGDTRGSMVSSVTPSTVACATKILSKGSL